MAWSYTINLLPDARAGMIQTMREEWLRRVRKIPNWAIAPVIFIGLALITLHSVLFQHGNLVLSAPSTDLILQFLPWRDFGFSQLRHGNFPLWNPYVYGGAPYFAGFQAALLYPPNWLHLLLSLTTAINWIIAIHLMAAGYCTYLWCRGRGASTGGSILAGIMFMFSGPYFLHIYAGHLPHLCVMIWVPLLFLSLDKLNQTAAMQWCLLGALSVAMQIFAGHPQYLYYTGMVSLLYVALCLIRSKHRLALGGGYVAIYVGACLLGAVQLLAGMQAAGESARSGGTDFAFASMFAMPPENFLTMLTPSLLGRLAQSGDTASTVTYFGRCYLWEMSVFVSISGLVLAVIGAVADYRKTIVLGFMVLICAVLALGNHLPLYRPLYDFLPEFDHFRGVAKFTFPMCLFLCAIAAAGFDAARQHPKSIKIAGIATAALALTFAATALSMSSKQSMWTGMLSMIEHSNETYVSSAQYEDHIFIERSAAAASHSIGWAAATMAAVCLLLWGTYWKRWAAYGLIVLAAVEMVIFASQNLATISPDLGYPQAWLDSMRAAAGDYRVVNGALRGQQEIQYLDAGMSLGIKNLWGYDPGVMKRYAETLAASQGHDPDHANQYLEITQLSPGLCQMLRCRFGLEAPNGIPSAIELSSPLPVAQLVPHWVIAPDRDSALSTILSNDFDPRKTVILESSPGIDQLERNVSGPAEIVDSSTDWTEIRTSLPSPNLLLITNNYSTGWRIVPLEGSDQTDYKILPANHTLLAIPLQAGHHHFRIEYLPMAYRVGKWISIFASVAYLGTLCGWVLRRRFLRSASLLQP